MDLVRAIAEEDGIDIIFQSVRLHQKHRLVEEAAFEALYHLSCCRQLTSKQKRQLCLEENVVVVMGTINNFIDSERITEFGSGLLLNMSFFAPIQQQSMASGKWSLGLLCCLITGLVCTQSHLFASMRSWWNQDYFAYNETPWAREEDSRVCCWYSQRTCTGSCNA